MTQVTAPAIETLPFGNTGHRSTRTIFGAAALSRVNQPEADEILEVVREFGVNHIDTAASYGDSELRLAPWLAMHRDSVFLATKVRERTYAEAMASIDRSLERMQVAQIDLIQFHNLVDEAEWETAMGPGGVLEAAVEARDAGKVRFIGVTGHGTYVAAMHLRSLERFPFDSVLLPYNHAMMAQPEYAADFEALSNLCQERGVAMQTIKSIARRRWQEAPSPRRSWYEPLRDPAAIDHAVRYVLSRPGIFLNTSSDFTLLRTTLEAASRYEAPVAPATLTADAAAHAVEPLFVRGVSDSI
jgi:aryl-alcohol dehydrogenase-like predicted oxidoreductase